MSEESAKLSPETTDWVKGAAILCVMINHLTNLYIEYPFGRGYAGGFVSVFFVFSGLGARYSLSRRLSPGGPNGGRLLLYYIDRALRIYPLYILALVLLSAAKGTRYSVFAYAGIVGPEIYWFVAAIIQCFAVAPLLFFGLKKWGAEKVAAGALTAMLAASAVCAALIFYGAAKGSPLFAVAPQYRNVWLGNIFLFAVGMALPEALERIKEPSRFALFIVFVVFAALLFVSRGFIVKSPALNVVPSTLFVLSAAWLSILIMKAAPFAAPAQKIAGELGRRSYSIYLFHFVYYHAAGKIFGGFTLAALAAILVLSPVFIFIAGQLETYQSKLASAIIERLAPRLRGAPQ